MTDTLVDICIGVPAAVATLSACLYEAHGEWSLKRFLIAAYCCIAFIATAIMIGSVYRQDLPFSAISACRDAFNRDGGLSALLCGGLYTVFYSALFAVPYTALHSALPDRSARQMVSVWAGLTLLLLGESLFAFARALPSFFLWGPWAFITVFFLRAISSRTKDKEERPEPPATTGE